MIISVHIPKTAGTAFREYLASIFGEGLAWDYGLTSPDTSRSILYCLEGWRHDLSAEIFLRRCAEMHIEVIHGHFMARFYRRIVPAADYICWLREPVDRVVSEFNQMRRQPDPHNPTTVEVSEGRMGLGEFAALDFQRDIQAKWLQGAALEDFAFVGLAEDFAGSLDRFDARFGISGVERPGRVNSYPPEVVADAALRDHIAALNRRDMDLYDEAVKLIGVATPVLPSDFDPAAYLALNADIADAGHDPVAHYLNHGRHEGRRWQ